jgi:hypothetical protein
MSLAPDDRTLICSARNHEQLPFLAALDLKTAEVRATYRTPTAVTALSEMAPDGQFACATQDGELHTLQLEGFQ